MGFPVNPIIKSISNGTAALVEASGSSPIEWVVDETGLGTVTFSADAVTMVEGAALILPIRSRIFSPYPYSISIDLTVDDWSADGTRDLYVNLLSSADLTFNDMYTTRSGCALHWRTNGRTDIEFRQSANAWYSVTGVNEVPVINRVKATYNRENWSDGTSAAQWVLEVFESSSTAVNTYSGDMLVAAGVTAEWYDWGKNVRDPEDVADCKGYLFLRMNDVGGTNWVRISDLTISYEQELNVGHTTYGPVMDGVDMELPSISLSAQPKLKDGILDVSLPPFNVPVSATAVGTDGLMYAIHTAKDHAMVAWLPAAADIRIDGELRSRQRLYQRSNNTPTDRKTLVDEKSPVTIQGSNLSAIPIIRLDDNTTGFTNDASIGVASTILVLDATDYEVSPPTSATTPRANYTHQVLNTKFAMGENSGACAIQAWGAQGVEIVNVEVSGAAFFAGMQDLPGSGGYVNGLKVTGGKYGVYCGASQPAPCVSGSRFYYNTVNAMYFGPEGNGSGNGNRQAAVMLGCHFKASAGRTMILQDTFNGSYDRGQLAFKDCVFEFDSPNTANVVINTNRNVYMNNCFVKNGARIIECSAGDISASVSTDWVYISELSFNLNHAPIDTSNHVNNSPSTIAPPNPYDITVAAFVDDVTTSANIYTALSGIAAPSSTVFTRWIIPTDYATWETATTNVRETYSATADGWTDNTAAISAAFAAATSGQSLFFGRGYWQTKTPQTIPPGVNVVGASKLGTIFIPPTSSSANAEFGSNAGSAYPLLRTSDTSSYSYMYNVCPWMFTDTDNSAAFSLHWRCPGHTWGITARTQRRWGYGGYPDTTMDVTVNRSHPLIWWTGKAAGIHWHHYTDNATSITGTYSHFKVQDTSAPIHFPGINAEHVDNTAGNIAVASCSATVAFYAIKNEGQWPILVATSSETVTVIGFGGNATGFIETSAMEELVSAAGRWDVGRTYTSTDYVSATGQLVRYVCVKDHSSSADSHPISGADGPTMWKKETNAGIWPEPSGYPAGWSPALFHADGVTNWRLAAANDAYKMTPASDSFGMGVRADKWRMGTRVESGAETFVTPYGSRPTLWVHGTFPAEFSATATVSGDLRLGLLRTAINPGLPFFHGETETVGGGINRPAGVFFYAGMYNPDPAGSFDGTDNLNRKRRRWRGKGRGI